MAPIHHMLAHFPVALLSLGFLVMLYRGIISSDRSRRLEDAVLLPCLLLGIAGSLGALASGLLIWPAEGMLTSTMGRNKIIMATWMVVIWTIVMMLRWRGGAAVWSGASRYVILALGGFGTILLMTTGTLGGHLLGSPSRFSSVLHQFGWSVYQTYWVPTWVLTIMLMVGVVGIIAGVIAKRRVAA